MLESESSYVCLPLHCVRRQPGACNKPKMSEATHIEASSYSVIVQGRRFRLMAGLPPCAKFLPCCGAGVP